MPTLINMPKKSFSSENFRQDVKVFIRIHLDYGDVICDQAYDTSFHQKLESINYNTAAAISQAIRVTSREQLFGYLVIETLKARLSLKTLPSFYKIFNYQSS